MSDDTNLSQLTDEELCRLAQGPEGGAAVTLLAMAWLAAWLTWGAARSEAQAGADSAGTAAA